MAQNAALASSNDSHASSENFFNGNDNDAFKSLQLNLNEDNEIDSDFIRRGELEEEDEESGGANDFDTKILTPKSTGSINEVSSSSQLDKVIARINNRLAASTS